MVKLSIGLSVHMAANVKAVVSTIRRIAGRRSDPKYAISSIGSLSAYMAAPTGVPS